MKVIQLLLHVASLTMVTSLPALMGKQQVDRRHAVKIVHPVYSLEDQTTSTSTTTSTQSTTTTSTTSTATTSTTTTSTSTGSTTTTTDWTETIIEPLCTTSTSTYTTSATQWSEWIPPPPPQTSITTDAITTFIEPPQPPSATPPPFYKNTCQQTQNPCQLQSDPSLTTFTRQTFPFTSTGDFLLVDSPDFRVSVHLGTHYSANRVGDVVVTESLTYACGGGDSLTINSFGLQATQTLECTSGECGIAGVLCRVVIMPGFDPIGNVQVQEVLYFGSHAIGGLCYGPSGICS